MPKKKPIAAPPPATFQEMVDASLEDLRRNKYRKLSEPERILLIEEVLDTAILAVRFAVASVNQQGTGAHWNHIKCSIDALIRLEARMEAKQDEKDRESRRWIVLPAGIEYGSNCDPPTEAADAV